jgi:hypothetical protein
MLSKFYASIVCAQYQYISGHFMENASLLDPSSHITEPMDVATTQPSPKPHALQQTYILLLIQ